MTVLVAPEAAAERYPHGVRARYTLGKCRCFKCRVANANYVYELTAEKSKPWRVRHVNGGWIVCQTDGPEIAMRTTERVVAFRYRDSLNRSEAVPSERETVEAGPARRHLAKLRAAGLGRRTIAERAGLSQGVVIRIARGEIRRVRRDTLDSIRGVMAEPRGSTLIDGRPTWVLLDALILKGYRRSWIAAQLGSRSRTPALQIKRDRVTAENARRVRALYERLTSAASGEVAA